MSLPASISTSPARPMGSLERFMKAIADGGAPLNREHWIISLAFHVAFEPSVTAPELHLQRAWQATRLQYPALAAVLRSGPLGEPELTIEPDNEEAAAWTSNTFTTHDNSKDADELFSELRPTAHATCHWIPSAAQLMIRSSHWRIDGVGMLMLGHSFMTALANVLHFGLDAPLSSYAITKSTQSPLGSHVETVARSLAQRPQTEGRAQGQRHAIPTQVAAVADDIIAKYTGGFPSIALPTREGSETTLPGATSRVAMGFDVPTTSKVVTGCRMMGVTVTSAVHAAIVRVAADFPQHPLAKSYAAFGPADLRRVIYEQDMDADVGPMGLFHLGLPICIEDVVSSSSGGAVKSFRTVARELQAVYGQDLVNFWDPADGSGAMVSLLDLVEANPRRTQELFAALLPPGLPPMQSPDLSSLGKIERYIQSEYGVGTGAGQGKVEVLDVWLGLDVLTRALQFHVWSWKGELRIAACFNRSFYEGAFVTDVIGKVREELLAGTSVYIA
ncbi:Uu.00g130860.m01.CDS01 [Anthostomella pinea]|uniref:Uu.00g130860.m01.CDS01 n=1 Tax=Anthostomella pinea TaxID=933095 RepID=A0AAI8VDG4_9PEZI|nr:Uu.00g130860.m01.CDS01 [Anthostomella pinea]